MKNVFWFLAFSFLFGCHNSYTVQVQNNTETIPKAQALKYLQEQSAKDTRRQGCLYTSFGINGRPYPEMRYRQSPTGEPWIMIGKKETDMSWKIPKMDFDCNAAWFSPYQTEYSHDEVQQILNKIATALEIMGAKRFTKQGE